MYTFKNKHCLKCVLDGGCSLELDGTDIYAFPSIDPKYPIKADNDYYLSWSTDSTESERLLK